MKVTKNNLLNASMVELLNIETDLRDTIAIVEDDLDIIYDSEVYKDLYALFDKKAELLDSLDCVRSELFSKAVQFDNRPS